MLVPGVIYADMIGVQWTVDRVYESQDIVVATEVGTKSHRRWFHLNGRYLDGGTPADLNVPRAAEADSIMFEGVRIYWDTVLPARGGRRKAFAP